MGWKGREVNTDSAAFLRRTFYARYPKTNLKRLRKQVLWTEQLRLTERIKRKRSPLLLKRQGTSLACPVLIISDKKKRRAVVMCSPRVAYDKCKRSRVDEAIREASVFLLTYVHIHMHTNNACAHEHIHTYT